MDCSSITTSNYSSPAKREDKPQLDPTANLTFDLHLSTKERDDRSKVTLPYIAAQHGLVKVASETNSAGQIFYQPDEMDDLDDSDPDDDLDI